MILITFFWWICSGCCKIRSVLEECSIFWFRNFQLYLDFDLAFPYRIVRRMKMPVGVLNCIFLVHKLQERVFDLVSPSYGELQMKKQVDVPICTFLVNIDSVLVSHFESFVPVVNQNWRQLDELDYIFLANMLRVLLNEKKINKTHFIDCVECIQHTWCLTGFISVMSSTEWKCRLMFQITFFWWISTRCWCLTWFF